MDTQFMFEWLSLSTGGQPVKTIGGEGPYVALNMRGIVTKALLIPDWERLLVLETDMLCPPDTLLRHMAHSEPVVGSLYFTHYPPYLPVASVKHKRGYRSLLPEEIRQLAVAGEGVYPVESVGLGCTSIRRDVLEGWPKHLPYFQSRYSQGANMMGENAFGEVSHDAWFCAQVRKQGYQIYLDPSIRCDHLSKVRVNLTTYAQHHGLTIPGVTGPVEATVEEVPLPPR